MRRGHGETTMNAAARPTILCSLSESESLAEAVSRQAQLRRVAIEERAFEGGEFKLRPLESVRGRTAFLLQCLAGTPRAPVAERLLRLLFLAYGLRDAGAELRIALLPYLTFARKDRRTQPRDPVNSRYIAELLESAGIDRVITLDVHNPAALDNSFRVPVDHLSAMPMMVDHIGERFDNDPLVVLSPDVGGVKRAQIFRELLEARLARPVDLGFLEKRRAQGQVSGTTLVADVKDRIVLVIDDLCATGHTLIRAAAACHNAGARATHVFFTHAPQLAGLAAVLADPNISSVATTDSVGFPFSPLPPESLGKLTTLSVAVLFGCAVQRLSAGVPLAPLLNTWPVNHET